jgi:hypothetical protein
MEYAKQGLSVLYVCGQMIQWPVTCAVMKAGRYKYRYVRQRMGQKNIALHGSRLSMIAVSSCEVRQCPADEAKAVLWHDFSFGMSISRS